jgi:hypothetical protein
MRRIFLTECARKILLVLSASTLLILTIGLSTVVFVQILVLTQQQTSNDDTDSVANRQYEDSG